MQNVGAVFRNLLVLCYFIFLLVFLCSQSCQSVLGQSEISQLSGVSLVRVVSAVWLVAACLVSLENSWHVRQGLQEDGEGVG